MHYFTYANAATTDDIKISVADLRDLVNAAFMTDEAAKMTEVTKILRGITGKNMLPPESLHVSTDTLPPEPPNHLAGPTAKF